MIKKISTLTIAMGMAAASLALAPETIFYEGFDSGNVDAFNTFVLNTAGTGAFATTSFTENSVTVPPFKGSHAAEVGLSATSSNTVRRFGKFTRSATATETILLTYWFYDSFTASPLFGASGAQQYIELRDMTPDFAPNATGSNFNQMIAIGTNSGGTTGLPTGGSTAARVVNGGWLYNVSNDSQYYKARIIGVGPTSGVDGTVTAPSWTTIGATTTGPDSWRRTAGWRKLQVAHSNSRVEFIVDGRRGFFWDHNRNANMDMVVIGSGLQTVNMKGYYDEVSVKAFAPFSINYKVVFQDFSPPSNVISEMPIEVEILDSLGSPVGPIETVFLDSNGTITVQAPAAGTYSLRIKGKTFLTKQINDLAVTSFGVFTGATSLINGDIDGDNFVGLDDFNILSNAFNTSVEDADFNEDADLDKDEFVGLDDFNILSNSFNTSGD